jgi:signal transduction histidine kinase
MADAEKTAWVLVNFLSNALRYSPEYATIHIQVVANASTVRLSVSDQGKGIEAGYLKRIFERYFQVPTQTNEVGGSGLGLSIARHFIEAQGGRIWAESPGLGQGSTFSFELPAAPAPTN